MLPLFTLLFLEIKLLAIFPFLKFPYSKLLAHAKDGI